MGQETVRCIQHWLNVNCGESLVEDGYLGTLTAMAIQRSLNNKKW
jgi:lysozyme family protein